MSASRASAGVIAAGFFAFSFVFAFLMPLLHLPIPVILFGHRFHGQPGAAIFAISATLMLAGAIGLWKPRRWSYPLIVGLQLVAQRNRYVPEPEL